MILLARIATDSTFWGLSWAAMRSALTNSTFDREDRKLMAKVDLPEPLQPPKTNISDIVKRILLTPLLSSVLVLEVK
jgi:hypothetical protein